MMRKATERDVPAIMKIVHDTVAIMETENNYQWASDYPLEPDFLGDIKDGALYVEERDGKIAGFLCVNLVEPAQYPTLAWAKPGQASVIHRMAVAVEFRRQGVGGALLAQADAVARANGTNYIKTDTFSENVKMNGLFRKHGFQYVGQVQFPNRSGYFNCYEKQI